MNILDTIQDEELFARWFQDKATWQAWFAFIAALFDVPTAYPAMQNHRRARASAQARVLDPFSTSAGVTKAKRELEDQTLHSPRLEVALQRLLGQLEAARVREKEITRLQVYKEVKAERESVINEFQEMYPELAAGIATLLEQIQTVDAKVTAINNDLPADAPFLLPIEQTTKTRLGWSVV